ncbi:hypothetical protein L6452_32027 [Arctium lappa]|uniref:Uncharacterized protein n=1 Tax=Arctium lappa TaxID=4217 RepID=A0ACB8Z4B3_ARCLA|nr:hypothetical protein L6452_32027 [Arctium lappa]
MKEFEHLKVQLEAIILATNNFAAENFIGKGGFGKVYKGEIDVHSKGKSMVAFKRLDRAFGQGNPEFWKEIMMLSIYRHENIVSLLGFCDESDEKILMYEYASKRSLDLYLNNNDLSWIQRLNICIGAARGLAYLHNPVGNQLRVLHRDIKSSNILLDENWNAMISDFGLSKLGPANQRFSFLVSNVVGTIGYCDPLYAETGFVTKESDVYSFGVVLFEVLCGRLCVSNNNEKRQPLIGLARESYEGNKINNIIYTKIKDEINTKSLKVFTTLAYRCLKRDHMERPLMTEIVRVLESALHYQVSEDQTSFYNNDGEEEEDCSFEKEVDHHMIGDSSHISNENKRLREMLMIICDNYNSLQTHVMELIQNKEPLVSNPMKRKVDETFQQSSWKRTNEELSKTGIQRVYVHTDPSDKSLVLSMC